MTFGCTIAGLGLAMGLVWLGYRGPDPALVPGPDRLPAARVVRQDATTAPRAASTLTPTRRAGFPTMDPDVERRTWRALVDRELGETAARAAGDAWTAEAREQFFVSLARLRDAAATRDRSRGEPESDDAIAAARRHRSAALEADALSRELFGMPLGALVQRTEPSVIEEVPPG